MSEAIHKNLVLQTQKKIIESEYVELKSAFDSIKGDKDREIDNLKTQLNSSRKENAIAGNERDELRKSNLHLETFRNELLKTRTEIEELQKLIAQKDEQIQKLSGVSEEKKPKDVGNTWVKKAPAKKKTTIKTETIKDAGKF